MRLDLEGVGQDESVHAVQASRIENASTVL